MIAPDLCSETSSQGINSALWTFLLRLGEMSDEAKEVHLPQGVMETEKKQQEGGPFEEFLEKKEEQEDKEQHVEEQEELDEVQEGGELQGEVDEVQGEEMSLTEEQLSGQEQMQGVQSSEVGHQVQEMLQAEEEEQQLQEEKVHNEEMLQTGQLQFEELQLQEEEGTQSEEVQDVVDTLEQNHNNQVLIRLRGMWVHIQLTDDDYDDVRLVLLKIVKCTHRDAISVVAWLPWWCWY